MSELYEAKAAKHSGHTFDREFEVTYRGRVCAVFDGTLGGELGADLFAVMMNAMRGRAHLAGLDAEMRKALDGDVLAEMEEAMGVDPDDDADDDDFDSDLDDPERTQLYAPEQIPMVTLEDAYPDAAYPVIVEGRT